jgi:dipeptidyl aminopeptidase/acylaminoacyl peptidase
MTTPNKRAFEPIDELHFKLTQRARLSPDGNQIVYTVRQNDLEKETTSTHLWRVDVTGENATQLTTVGTSNTAPEWSPDGSQIAFCSDRVGKAQVFLLPASGGEARQFTHLKQGVGEGPYWSPDGKLIAFTAGSEAEPPDLSRPYRITRFVYRFDGIGYLDTAVQNVYIQALDAGGPKKLTDHANMAHGLHWSPDGSQILFAAGADPDRPDLFSSEIRTVDLQGQVRQLIGLDWGWVANAIWTTDGKRIVFGGTQAGKPMGSKMDLWVLDPASGKFECRTAGLKFGQVYGFGNIFALDSEHVLGGTPRSGMGEIYRISLSGKEDIQPVIVGKRDAQLQDLNAEQVLFIDNRPENPSELAIADQQGKNEHRLTTHNTTWLSEIALPKVETLHFTSENGIEVEGWIMLPENGTAPYPTILYNHGGPHGAYGYSYRHDFLMLIGAGYAVLYINPRGSVGYGEEFSAALSGNWGVMDYKDLMAGVDDAVQKGLADPNRMGVCGLSYGGYLTCFIVGQTNRFKAAVAENPITDLVSRYGTADMGAWGSLGEMGGKPHEIPEIYRVSSPVTYAHRCKTPTLLVQGESDYRCPAGQSEQFYTMLKANGCIAEMLRLPNMPHVGSISGPIPVQKAQNEALLDWMDRYVMGKSKL